MILAAGGPAGRGLYKKQGRRGARSSARKWLGFRRGLAGLWRRRAPDGEWSSAAAELCTRRRQAL